MELLGKPYIHIKNERGNMWLVKTKNFKMTVVYEQKKSLCRGRTKERYHIVKTLKNNWAIRKKSISRNYRIFKIKIMRKKKEKKPIKLVFSDMHSPCSKRQTEI